MFVCGGNGWKLIHFFLCFFNQPSPFPTHHQTEYLVRFTEAGLGADEPPEWFPAAALRADPAGAAALAAFEAATGSTATLVPLTRAVGEAAPPPRQQQPPADSGGRLALTRAPAAPPRRPPALGFRGVIRADAADAYDWAGFRPLTRPAAATVVVLDAGASGGVSGGRSAGVPARLWMDARPRRADGLPPTQSPDDNESEPPPSSSAGDASDQDDAPPPPLTQLPLTQLPLEASPPPEAQPPDPPPRSRLRKPPSTRVARVVRPPGDAPRVRFAVSPAAESVEASESD